MKAHSTFEVYSAYLEASQSKAIEAQLTSVLVRFLIPQWGGTPPKGNRATSEEKMAGIDFLKKLPISIIIDSIDTLEKAFEANSIDEKNRRSYRCIYKAFVKWTKENGYSDGENNDNRFEQDPSLFKNKYKVMSNNHGKKNKEPYILMAKDTKKKLVFSSDYINEELKQDIIDYEKFREKKCGKRTIQRDITIIRLMLGWLHRYKNFPLENLRLESIIQHQQLRASIKERKGMSREEVNQKNFDLQEMAIEVAKENVKLIREYLDFVGGHPKSRLMNINTFITIAEFIYRNDLDDDKYIDKDSFPIVKRLRKIKEEVAEEVKVIPESINYSGRSIPWVQLMEILNKLRKKANTDFHFIKTGEKKYKKQRSQSSIYGDLQDFLSLAFITLLPPDRSRTFYSLEIGRTLIKGIYKNNIFTPAEKMPEGSEQKWYINLKPLDYKTGKAHGEFLGEIENFAFSDGTYFYDYIQKWIDEGREFGQKCNHNYFFRGKNNYQRLSVGNWRGRILRIIQAETGVPVPPSIFRKMFVTHINESGATDQEKESAAYWMHHSVEMQKKVYNKQSNESKAAPIKNFMKRMNEKNSKNDNK